MCERVGLVNLFLLLVIPWIERTKMILADGEDLLAVHDSLAMQTLSHLHTYYAY